MRTVGKLVGLVATSALVASPAFAGSSNDELAEMRELVKGLEQKVDAQQEQIDHQSGMLEDAQKVVREQRQEQEQGALSGMSEFWQAIDVNMSVAGSYAYNFHNPDSPQPEFPGTGAGSPGGGINKGANGLFYPFHGDHNSFQVDQVWIDIGKAVTEESRAGFMFTTLFGNTATFLGQGSSTDGRFGSTADSASDLYVHQAYVSWLAPVVETKFDFGKFMTPIGMETADASKNWNITRGNVYNLFQPIDHTGAMATKGIGPVSISAAIVNSGHLSNGSPDLNEEKTYIGKVGFASDAFSTSVAVLYGADGVTGPGNYASSLGDNGDDYGLLDLIVAFNADRFQAWVNADWAWVEESAAQAYGVAVAGRVLLTDDLSTALRLEYARDYASHTLGGPAPGGWFAGPAPTGIGIGGSRHTDIYGVTGTLAYVLADNLTLKGEVRWDQANEFSGTGVADEFFTNTSGGSQNQVVGLAQVIYAF